MDDQSSRHIQLWRSYLEEALPYVQGSISSQTGFLHFHRKSYRGEVSLSIPVLENLLTALLLLRTKHQEYVTQAKDLLHSLFSFRIEEGDECFFPAYLHDYPKKAPDSLLITMMAVLLVIKNDFSSILGASLLRQTEGIFYALFTQAKKRAWPIKDRLLLHLVERKVGDKTREHTDLDEWLSTWWWKDLRLSTLLCLHLEGDSEGFFALFSRLRSVWNTRWKKNVSYGMNALFYKTQAVPHLFEYYLSCMCGEKMRSLPVMPFLLDIAWINPLHFPSHIPKTQVRKDESASCFSLSFPSLEMKALLFQPKPHELLGFHPLRFATEHFSPVVHFPRARLVHIEKKEGEMVLFIEGENESEEEEALFQFFIEAKELPVQFLSARSMRNASYWKEGEHVSIVFDEVRLKLSIDHPRASFHLLKGDRPGQLLSSEEGFDWIVEARFLEGKRSKTWQVGIEWCT